MKRAILAVLILLTGCSQTDPAIEYLEAKGMTDIRFRGYDLFSCDSNSIYAHRFLVEQDGSEKLMIVCAEDGFKNPSIKYINTKSTKEAFR